MTGSKARPTRAQHYAWADSLGLVLESCIHLLLGSAAVVLALVGQWVLTGVIVLVAVGVFLRFKRLRQRRRVQRQPSTEA